MLFKNDYEVFAWDFSQENIMRVDVRLTAIGPSKLEALINLREQIDNKIFQERMHMHNAPTQEDVWDGDGSDMIAY
jgi:hypothetical protein